MGFGDGPWITSSLGQGWRVAMVLSIPMPLNGRGIEPQNCFSGNFASFRFCATRVAGPVTILVTTDTAHFGTLVESTHPFIYTYLGGPHLFQKSPLLHQRLGIFAKSSCLKLNLPPPSGPLVAVSSIMTHLTGSQPRPSLPLQYLLTT